MSADIRDWVGLPFAWCGQGPDAYDCWTIVQGYLAEHGIALPNYAYCPGDYNGVAKIAASVSTQPPWQRVEGEPEPLDVVLMGPNARLHHLGVVVEPDLLLHTSERTGSLIQRLSLLTRVSPYRQWRAYRWVE